MDASGYTGSLAFEHGAGGYKHFIRSRHNGSGVPGNGIDFWLNTSTNKTASTSPGVSNIRVLAVDTEALASGVVGKFYQGLKLYEDLSGKTQSVALDIDNAKDLNGGLLEVYGESAFHHTVFVSGRGYREFAPYSYSYRYMNNGDMQWNGYQYRNLNATATRYSMIIGGRLMVCSGGEINIMSDIRTKKKIETIDGAKALDVVRKQRAVSFKYKNTDDNDQKYGWIAQECLKHEYLRDSIRLYNVDDKEENDRLVMCAE
ncbi:hypothetical protein HK097_004491, partial [Rhizophlyctis rosea]